MIILKSGVEAFRELKLLFKEKIKNTFSLTAYSDIFDLVD